MSKIIVAVTNIKHNDLRIAAGDPIPIDQFDKDTLLKLYEIGAIDKVDSGEPEDVSITSEDLKDAGTAAPKAEVKAEDSGVPKAEVKVEDNAEAKLEAELAKATTPAETSTETPTKTSASTPASTLDPAPATTTTSSSTPTKPASGGAK